MTDREAQRAEVDRNHETFLRELPALLLEHRGRHALYRNGERAGIFDGFGHALAAGDSWFVDRIFSIQTITDEVEHDGLYQELEP